MYNYSLFGVKLYTMHVAPLNTNMLDRDIFLDIFSIIVQLTRQAGISINDTSTKFRYLLPAMPVELMFSP